MQPHWNRVADGTVQEEHFANVAGIITLLYYPEFIRKVTVALIYFDERYGVIMQTVSAIASTYIKTNRALIKSSVSL